MIDHAPGCSDRSGKDGCTKLSVPGKADMLVSRHQVIREVENVIEIVLKAHLSTILDFGL